MEDAEEDEGTIYAGPVIVREKTPDSLEFVNPWPWIGDDPRLSYEEVSDLTFDLLQWVMKKRAERERASD